MPGKHEEVVDVYAARRRANDESMAWAINQHQPWSSDDDDVLVEYWVTTPPSIRDEVDISQALGRSIEACRCRCEIIRKRLGLGGTVVTRTVKVEVTKGWLVGYCFACGRLTDVYSDGHVSQCEDCK